MAEGKVKYRCVSYVSAKKKYRVVVAIRKGEEGRVTAKYQGKKIINGGLFADPLLGAQLADK